MNELIIHSVIKSVYSKSAIKFEKKSHRDLTLTVGDFFSNFVGLSENLAFKISNMRETQNLLPDKVFLHYIARVILIFGHHFRDLLIPTFMVVTILLFIDYQ